MRIERYLRERQFARRQFRHRLLQPYAACRRSSADIVDQPSSADDPSSTEVEYFLAPCVCNSMGLTGAYGDDGAPAHRGCTT
jgi:hypothetical protein